jgi:hypothetical protein
LLVDGVDSCANGVCVPVGIHSGLHTKEYMNQVAERLLPFEDSEEGVRAAIKDSPWTNQKFL